MNQATRKPFWLIDGKMREADFFLEKLKTAPDLDDARFYFSAFVSAARSVTYAMQVCLKGLAGSSEWWELQRQRLKGDPIAKYFHTVRNITNHTGLNPLQVFINGLYGAELLLAGDDGESVPEIDAVRAAEKYMRLLVDVASETYGAFWSNLNLSDDLTIGQLQSRGITFEQLETEFGMPVGWTRGLTDEQRFHFLKQHSRTDIVRLRRRYLESPE
jgi:hypothetical protein